MNDQVRPPILVVEDENVVAMDLVSSLKRLNYPVVAVAASAEEAVDLAEKRKPGLVLMDIQLRGELDGIWAAQEIQQRLSIPVVYLSAYSDAATLDRARMSQPFGYVIKPFEDREVEVAIQIALFRHQMERAIRDGERRLDAILSSIGDAVIATDTGRRITFLNRSAETMLGWRSERARGRLLTDVLKVSPQENGVHRLMRGPDSLPVELVESPVLDADGQPSGYVTAIKDISERLRAQNAYRRELLEKAAREAAEREHERARLMSEVSLALMEFIQPLDMSTALRKVADLLVPSVADWCQLHIDEQPQPVQIRAFAHPRRSEIQHSQPGDANAVHGPRAVMQSGRGELLERLPEELLAGVAPDPEQRAALQAGMTSYLCVPLRARNRMIGALSLVSSQADRRYGPSDLAFAQALADRAAVAIENARLFNEAREARTEVERRYRAEQKARAEAETLFRIADAITEAQFDLQTLVQRVTDEATALVGAQFGAFFYNVTNAEGQTYMLYTLTGASRNSFDKFGMPRNTPIFAPTFAGQEAVRLDDVRKDPQYGQMAPHHGMPQGHLPVTSYLAVPVSSRTGGVIGGLFFGHPEPGQFSEEDERLAKALAAHAGIAIDNARLYSATREAEERQGRLVKDLERTVRFSEMFVGILGHDLRNPLSGITTAASLILGRADSDRVAIPTRRILSSAQRMSRMIDQILDFTRVRLGRGIPLNRKATDLSEVCRQVIDELKGDADQEAELVLDVRGAAVGMWDPDRLWQLISNLAGNALQHRVPRTPVLLDLDGSHSDRITLRVRNQGQIPPDLLPVVFEPMRTGAHGKREGSSGLGLGLYISQQIALAHGGAIAAESTEPEGTCFQVALPRMTPAESEAVFSQDKPPAVADVSGTGRDA
jgi:signal transduction histidine kinase/CheY-like chemotaxis protein